MAGLSIILGALHSKEEYSGIGLAISKKILENLRGKIWGDAQCGNGGAFHFSNKRHFLVYLHTQNPNQ
jgi:light-regulated signal transduction histidine kinase (bacteriophytochrome)